MKADNPTIDFKEQVKDLEGFILILNNEEEKALFEKSFFDSYTELFPLSAIAINYELANSRFLEKINDSNIKLGIKLHPRLSNITLDKFSAIASFIENIKFDFIIIDCFYYGSSLESHINLELSIFIAKYFKNTKIILAHGGGHKVLEYMLYTRDLKNIYFDFSLTSNYLKNTSVRQDILNFIKFNYKKVFFGSDYPDFTVKKSIDTYIELLQDTELNVEQKESIFADNILEYLKSEDKSEK
jgi:predicted TIM-barrel fold metal-dependent hydrolase